MGRGSPICERVRKKIVEYFKNNVSQRQIAKALQISSSTVHNIIKRFRETGEISVRKEQLCWMMVFGPSEDTASLIGMILSLTLLNGPRNTSRKPTLQPFLQERKHYSNRAPSGVFSARRTPVCEQTPLQCIGLPCRRSSSLSDGLYHSLWETTQVCRVPSRSHTWRFHRSGRGCHMVPSPWERRSFLRGMRQAGAVARRMSSGNQVRVGQNGATSRTCSSSSLTLHSVCASRLTGGNAYLHRARGQLCASASVPREPATPEGGSPTESSSS